MEKLSQQPLNKKYKIAIVLPHFYPYVGGGEKLFFDIASGLVEAGHEVRVIAEKVDEEHNGYKEINGIGVYYCPWKSAFGHPFPERKDIEPHIAWCDLVHTSTYTTTPIVSRLAKKYKKPSVITVHEVRGPMWFKADTFFRACIFWCVEQFTVRQPFSAYHAVSEASKRDTEKYTARKNVVRIYNYNELRPGLEDPSFSLHDYFGISRDAKVILYYGRPGKTKGIDVYKNALLSLCREKEVPENFYICFILGAEPADLRRAFVKAVGKAGLTDKVLIADSLDRAKLASAILQADMVIVPSLTEGFGFSALEACQMGKPLIHSDGGALPEVVYGKTLSFQNGNVNDLKEKLWLAISEGESAFTEIPERNFTKEETLGQIIELYGDLLKK